MTMTQCARCGADPMPDCEFCERCRNLAEGVKRHYSLRVIGLAWLNSVSPIRIPADINDWGPEHYTAAIDAVQVAHEAQEA